MGRRDRKTITGVATDFVYDGLNSVQERSGQATTNSLTGLGVPTSYTYEPFGATNVTGAPTSNPYDFTGRETDLTGLKYYRARYYHSGLQRFTSEDPLGFLGSDINLYAYANNSPTTQVDPLGLYSIEYTDPACNGMSSRKTDCGGPPPPMYACWICRWSVRPNVPPPPRGNPLPKNWTSDWDWDFSRYMDPSKGPRWIDPKGGEHRWHPADRWHPDHWDYNPRDVPNSPWRHYYELHPFWWMPGGGGPLFKGDS